MKSNLTAGQSIPAKNNLQTRRGRIGLMLISPWVLGFLFLKLGPILASFVFSLTDFNMLQPGETTFVGLANYTGLLRDEVMWAILFSTVGLAVITVPFQLVLSIFLSALLTSPSIVGRDFYRTLIFLPSIIPGIAIFSIWAGFLDPAAGWLNRLVMVPLNLPPYPGITSEAGRNFLLILLSVWNIGPAFLIISGAMMGVPTELYEAAKVDGAGPIYRLLNITLPVISPSIFFSLLISLITIFGGSILLDRSITFSSGGQSPMDMYIGYVMFGTHELAYAAGLAWIMFVIVIGIAVYLFRTADKWVYYPSEGDA